MGHHFGLACHIGNGRDVPVLCSESDGRCGKPAPSTQYQHPARPAVGSQPAKVRQRAANQPTTTTLIAHASFSHSDDYTTDTASFPSSSHSSSTPLRHLPHTEIDSASFSEYISKCLYFSSPLAALRPDLQIAPFSLITHHLTTFFRTDCHPFFFSHGLFALSILAL